MSDKPIEKKLPLHSLLGCLRTHLRFSNWRASRKWRTYPS